MSNTDEKNILVCMHGRAIRILMCYLTNTPLSEMDQFGHKNTSLYLLQFDGSDYSIEMANDQSHLIGIENIEFSEKTINDNKA